VIINIPMFEIEPEPPAVKGRPFPGPRIVRRVLCPGGAHQGGLIVGIGEHLVWRSHDVHTVTGIYWPCWVGGQCLCEAPAPAVDGKHTPTCADPTSGRWSW
jgi:hypothetical protein